MNVNEEEEKTGKHISCRKFFATHRRLIFDQSETKLIINLLQPAEKDKSVT